VINPEQIPDEVVRVINEACDSGRAWNARDTLAAAINAWPGWFNGNAWPDLAPAIVLPLSHENNDD
jgi:hypothetical protein